MIPSAVGQYVLCFRRCAYISTDPCIHPLQVWLSTGRVSTRTHSLGEERMRAEPPHRRPTISALKVCVRPSSLSHISHPSHCQLPAQSPRLWLTFSFSCVASTASVPCTSHLCSTVKAESLPVFIFFVATLLVVAHAALVCAVLLGAMLSRYVADGNHSSAPLAQHLAATLASSPAPRSALERADAVRAHLMASRP